MLTEEWSTMVSMTVQWTPKDAAATLKLNGRCDFIMNEVLK